MLAGEAQFFALRFGALLRAPSWRRTPVLRTGVRWIVGHGYQRVF